MRAEAATAGRSRAEAASPGSVDTASTPGAAEPWPDAFVLEYAVRAVDFVIRRRRPGVFNVAGAGRLPWREVASICATRLLPLPPVHPALAIAPLVRLGVFELPPELEALLRYGRGVDTRRLTDAGFDCRYTSAGAVENFVRRLRLRRSTGRRPASYTYEHDVEQFFRYSPSVVQAGDG